MWIGATDPVFGRPLRRSRKRSCTAPTTPVIQGVRPSEKVLGSEPACGHEAKRIAMGVISGIARMSFLSSIFLAGVGRARPADAASVCQQRNWCELVAMSNMGNSIMSRNQASRVMSRRTGGEDCFQGAGEREGVWPVSTRSHKAARSSGKAAEEISKNNTSHYKSMLYVML